MPTPCIILYFIKEKPGQNSKYYIDKYCKLYGIAESSSGTTPAKWFQRLRRDGYIISKRKGNEYSHFLTGKEWEDTRIFLDESKGWDKVDRTGKIQRCNNDE